MAVGQIQQARACGICSTVGHLTDMCPALQEDEQQVDALGGFVGQRKYDPYSNTYNLGWMNHLNFSYAKSNNFQNFQQRQFYDIIKQSIEAFKAG